MVSRTVLSLAALRRTLAAGQVIPAHPLALTSRRRLDERYQRGLTRYYLAAGAGGLAVGVHTTQFGIHDPRVGLYRPVLELASVTAAERGGRRRPVLIAGVCGGTPQALAECRVARDLGYDAGLLSFSGLEDWTEAQLLRHAAAVAEVIPLVGFYLQPAVGGRALGVGFWRRFLEIDRVVAIKVAPFDRYQTLDVIRAVAESGRARELSLYTGNDDQIVLDLLTPWKVGNAPTIRMAGGLLGQWACWTRRAVELLRRIHRLRGRTIAPSLLTLAGRLTEANGAIFDVAHGFRGCIPGIHEVLRSQGLLPGTWCLDPAERLSPGQAEGIARVRGLYPDLTDDAFVAEHRDAWLG